MLWSACVCSDPSGRLTLGTEFAILRLTRRFDLSLRAHGDSPDKYG